MGNGSERYTAEQVITAIKGSGGIKTTIAQRLGCHRHTVTNYIERYVTVQQAYQEEAEMSDDVAESVVMTNIRLAHKEQAETKRPVDSSDAKWWLERRRRDKFSARQEVTGAEGQELIFRVVYGDDGTNN